MPSVEETVVATALAKSSNPANERLSATSVVDLSIIDHPGNAVKSLVHFEWSEQIAVLHKIGSPLWLYSCLEKRNIWANNAALGFFGRPGGEFMSRSSYEPGDPDAAEAFEEMNGKLRESVELRGEALQCRIESGVDVLPGWIGTPSYMVGVSYGVTYQPFEVSKGDALHNVCLVQIDMHIKQLSLVQANTSRLMVMHQYNPIHSFLFDENGTLLIANPSALEYYREEDVITLRLLFEVGVYEDEETRNQEYQTALDKVFKERKTHRCQQQHTSRRDPSKKKWIELEMWPTIDPVTNKPSVLVSKQNITHSKEAEEALMRQRNRLENENRRLEKELEVMIGDHKPFDQDSPVDKVIKCLDEIMEGNIPSVTDLAQLKKILVTTEDLHQPLQLKEQLLAEGAFERDVGLNLLQLLGNDKGQEENDGASGQKSAAQSSLKLQNPQGRSSAIHGRQPFSNRMIARGLTRDRFVPNAIVPAVEEVLMKSEKWTWNAFELRDVTQGYPCSTFAFWTFQKAGLVNHFGLDEVKLARFLRRIEEGYPDNPYHNRTHSCDVLQTLHMIMVKGGLFPHHADRICQLAAYISAIIHDFEHGGLNNDYLVRSADVLAIRYNDRSPLENHHLAGAFQVLRHPECYFIQKLTADQIAKFRQMCIEMVLATDMKQHFNILSQFQAKLKTHSMEGSGSGQSQEVSKMDDVQLSLALQVSIKCSDVGHLACCWNVHRRWVGLLEEEFFRQGDQERINGMKISPLMDRRKPGITKSQVGFFDIVALPLFRNFASVFPNTSPLLESLEDNFQLWKDLEQGGSTPS